jgi:hypothetical protein
MDLAFDDAELVAEGENLDLECGFGLPAEDKEIEQRADDGVEETQDHEQGSWRLGRGECWRCRCRGDHRGQSRFLNGTGLAMRLLHLYPRHWRERYEAEVRVLLEEHTVRLTTLADLLAGAVDARLNAGYPSQEEHMPSSHRQGPRYTRCSFCGKDPDQVKRLVAGPGVYICDKCIKLCYEVLASDAGPGSEVLASDAGPPCEPPAGPTQPPRRDWRMVVRRWLRILFHSAAPGTAGASGPAAP